MPSGSKSTIGALLDIGKLDVVAIECREIATVDGRTPGREGMALRRQLVANGRILDLLADLATDELGRGVVRRKGQEDVVVSQGKPEAEPVPGGFVDLLTFLRRNFESRNAVGYEAETGRRIAGLPPALRIIALTVRSSSSVTGAFAAGMLKFAVRWKTVR